MQYCRLSKLPNAFAFSKESMLHIDRSKYLGEKTCSSFFLSLPQCLAKVLAQVEQPDEISTFAYKSITFFSLRRHRRHLSRLSHIRRNRLRQAALTNFHFHVSRGGHRAKVHRLNAPEMEMHWRLNAYRGSTVFTPYFRDNFH